MSLPYFEAHCDVLSRCLVTGESLYENGGQFDLKRLSGYEPHAQILAIFHDCKDVPPEGLFGRVKRMHELFVREKIEFQVLMSNSMLSIEGSDLLGCSLERLDEISDWGVVAVNLTWNNANAISGSHCVDSNRGLSAHGMQFVRKLESMGIYADVSHLSDAGFWDLEKITTLPMFASHSNSRAVYGHTRNLTDDQFRAIRDSGGVVGINLFVDFVGSYSMDSVLAHFDHFLELGGEKNLALGCDWDGHIVAAGGINGAQDMALLAEAMRGHGYGEKLIRAIFYDNLARLMKIKPSSQSD